MDMDKDATQLTSFNKLFLHLGVKKRFQNPRVPLNRVLINLREWDRNSQAPKWRSPKYVRTYVKKSIVLAQLINEVIRGDKSKLSAAATTATTATYLTHFLSQ